MSEIATIPDDTLDTWDGPTLLRWLAGHTTETNYFAERALDWEGEVARFADYEGRDRDEWEADALHELRAEVRNRIRNSRPFPQGRE